MSEEETVSTLKEALGETYDDLNKAEEDVESGEIEEEIAEEVEVKEDEIIEPLEAGGDESGEDEEEESEETSSPESETEETELDAIEPMEHWDNNAKEMFGGLPRDAQEYLVRRDKELQASVTRKHQEVADIRRALDPVRDDLVKYGVSEADAVRRLIGAHKRLVESPLETIRELAVNYGIDIGQLTGDDDNTTVSSDSAAMRKITELEEKLARTDEARQAEQASKVGQQLEEFKEGHEFFNDEIQREMAALAWSYHRNDQRPPELEVLYEKACWANESIREKMLEKQEQKKLESDKGNISKAKRAARTKVKSRKKTSTAKEGKPKTLREELLDNANKDALQAR